MRAPMAAACAWYSAAIARAHSSRSASGSRDTAAASTACRPAPHVNKGIKAHTRTFKA